MRPHLPFEDGPTPGRSRAGSSHSGTIPSPGSCWRGHARDPDAEAIVTATAATALRLLEPELADAPERAEARARDLWDGRLSV